MKIIKIAVLLGAFGILAPEPPQSMLQQANQVPEQEVAAPRLLGAALNAAGDLNGFCARQPDTCATAQSLTWYLLAKAKYSIRLIYEWAAEPEKTPKGETNPVLADYRITHSGPKKPLFANEDDDSQSTLRLDDLLPDWRGPVDKTDG